MMRLTLTLCSIAALASTGCATKNYGRQGELTDFETRTLTCREVELETARVHGFLSHVEKESEFDARSVLSFLGDFGVGNVMERSSAISSATARLAQLQRTRTSKGCGGLASDGALPPGLAPAVTTAPVAAIPKPAAANAAPVIPTRTGKDVFQAERHARDAGCGSRSAATLVGSGPGFETYTLACTGGDVMVLRCEMGNCRALK